MTTAHGLQSIAWLLVVVPAVSAAILLLGGKYVDRWGHWLGALVPAALFVYSVALFFSVKAESNREVKERLVREGKAHAALVFDGDVAVAWAEYGSCAELPNIYHRKQYDEETDLYPDYRITCLFVDKRHRRHGVSVVALHGALDLIAQAGGGVVEGYPHDPEGRRVAVLYDGTRNLFENEGFELVRRKGQRNTVMRRTVAAAE